MAASVIPVTRTLNQHASTARRANRRHALIGLQPALRTRYHHQLVFRAKVQLPRIGCRATESKDAPTASTPDTSDTSSAAPATPVAASNGVSIAAATEQNNTVAPPVDDLVYREPGGWERFLTSLRLAFALPWRRFKKGSVLAFTIEGDIGEQLGGRFNRGRLSMPQLTGVLRKAAVDPRVAGICFEVGPLGAGWGKLQELRAHIAHFQESGKFCIAYMTRGGEKEYYLASAAKELYVAPSASISLRGFSVAGTFLRGVFDKVGIEPQVKRIGEYKSAGDQLLRSDMSQPQREQLGAILEDIYAHFVTTVAKSRGKTEQEVEALLQAGVFDPAMLVNDGWVSGLRYEDEIIDDLKKRTNTETDKDLKKVGLRKYASVNPSAFGLLGKKRIAIIRGSGAIVGGSSDTGGSITANSIIAKLRSVAKNKAIAAVVLRIDSPGGDALASDLMWREIKKLAEKKPVIASMSDVAASGGYYMAMAANKIVADPLTITGSIGVVTGKFNLQELYKRIGYAKTTLSKGRYAELLNESRSFTAEEEDLFDRNAQFAYASFRDKAAASRGMEVETMQKVAQGRVWSGQRAIEVGLVDALGGLTTAIAMAKAAAGIPAEERITAMELSRANPSPLALLRGGASAQQAMLMLAMAAAGGAGSSAAGPAGALASAVGALALDRVLGGLDPALVGLSGQAGGMNYVMTDVDAASVGSSSVGLIGDLAGRQFLQEEDGEGSWVEDVLDAVFD